MEKPARIVGWSKGIDKDGNVSRYFETNGTHNVVAYRVKDGWRFEVWDVTTRPHKRLGDWATAAEAKGAVR